MIKSILLAVDGSVYTDAVVTYGLDLAAKLKAHIRAYSIVDVRIYDWVLNTGAEGYMPVIPSNMFHEESHKFHNERADTLLNIVGERINKAGLSFDSGKLEGSPAELICDLARQVDMVIMGARGDYARWGDRLLGATLEAVSRQIQTPLMITDKTYVPLKTLTCAYDRSESSTKALKLSAYLAQELKLPLEVVTINEDDSERADILSEARKYLQPYQITMNLRPEKGDPAEVLIQVTEKSPQPTALLMGSYGHSRIREAIIGSTTVQVMRQAVKPIILTK
jgi:nucleotide-binding universal stress UspA family protein